MVECKNHLILFLVKLSKVQLTDVQSMLNKLVIILQLQHSILLAEDIEYMVKFILNLGCI